MTGLVAIFLALAGAWAQSVEVPLAAWDAVQTELAASADPAPPPAPVVAIARSIDGTFRRGVFSGTLDARFEVLTDGHVRVPVLDSGTSIGEVLLDGRPTSLLRQGAMYTVGVSEPGEHRLSVRFFHGREDDRFARRLAFALPPSGPTAVAVRVGERDIDATLAQGAITSVASAAGGTVITGHLDARGQLDLSWTRRLAHTAASEVRTTARVHTLYTLSEALVRGVTAVDVSVLEGEVDRVDLVLPDGVEVVDVSGDAVLQWQPDGDGLAVLLRYLVSDAAQLRVHFQFPIDMDVPVDLRMPLPADGVPFEGAAGVQGPAGIQAHVAAVEGAVHETVRDLPPALTDLSASPLLLGYTFDAAPAVRLELSRHGEVALTSTLVDDIQASTVLLEDGSEITKARLRIRNHTRQYLGVTLPDDAVLTHSLIDGRPVRPAVSGDQLLVPLRQSERVDAGPRQHVVQPGETLGGIALRYYADAAEWRRIVADNAWQITDGGSVEVGQTLAIAPPDAAVREHAFVVELAWTRPHAALGWTGRRGLELPALDVDAVSVTWHVYLPTSIEPLVFDANLRQLSHLRYGPFRRALELLERALGVDAAWAGGGYVDILSQRKAIYRNEARQKDRSADVVGTFPLVGEKVRFARILLGRDVPRVAVTWVADGVVPVVHALGVLAMAGAVLLVARRRSVGAALLVAGPTVALFAVAHFVLGLNRHLLLGAELGLAVAVLWARGPAWWARVAEGPPRLERPELRTVLTGVGGLLVLLWLLGNPLLLQAAGVVTAIALLRRTA